MSVSCTMRLAVCVEDVDDGGQVDGAGSSALDVVQKLLQTHRTPG